MNTIETLNSKIDNLLYEYEKLKLQNISLSQELDNLRNDNDELVRNNQDMFLKINSTIALIKAQTSE